MLKLNVLELLEKKLGVKVVGTEPRSKKGLYKLLGGNTND